MAQMLSSDWLFPPITDETLTSLDMVTAVDIAHEPCLGASVVRVSVADDSPMSD